MGKLTTILLLFFFSRNGSQQEKTEAINPSDQYLVMKVPPCKAVRVNSLSKAEKMKKWCQWKIFIHSVSFTLRCEVLDVSAERRCSLPSPPLDKNSIVPWDAYKKYFPVYHQTLFISTHERALLISCLQSSQTDFRFS